MGIEMKPRGYWAKVYAKKHIPARHPMTGKVMRHPPVKTQPEKRSSGMAGIERKFAAVAHLID